MSGGGSLEHRAGRDSDTDFAEAGGAESFSDVSALGQPLLTGLFRPRRIELGAPQQVSQAGQGPQRLLVLSTELLKSLGFTDQGGLGLLHQSQISALVAVQQLIGGATVLALWAAAPYGGLERSPALLADEHAGCVVENSVQLSVATYSRNRIVFSIRANPSCSGRHGALG